MPDYLKLFYHGRLTPSEPEHLTYIKGRLAALKIEATTPVGVADYKHWSEFYGIDLDVAEKPVTKTEDVVVKKRGRKPKTI